VKNIDSDTQIFNSLKQGPPIGFHPHSYAEVGLTS